MRFLIRPFLFNCLALYLATMIIPGVSYAGGWQTLALAAAVLSGFNLLVKPILKLLFLPINLLTLGMFRWVINVIILRLLIFVVPQISIVGFYFPGFSYQAVSLPAMKINSFWNLILTSFFLSFVWEFLRWLT